MSAPILRLSTSQRPVFLVNSRLGHFSAASSCSRCSPFTIMRHPFSRSYGVSLPSSLTRVLSRALGFSPRLPVSVCGTGARSLASGFSWQLGVGQFSGRIRTHSRLRLPPRGFACAAPYSLGQAIPSACCAYPSASPLRSIVTEAARESQPVVHRLRLSASA